ncbi:MAG TPA: hypothetical protein DCG06_07345, partial [Deltaproteobacteria bacterium]|nr:hypothetical protein [Deltaproteobacteria bacterium]
GARGTGHGTLLPAKDPASFPEEISAVVVQAHALYGAHVGLEVAGQQAGQHGEPGGAQGMRSACAKNCANNSQALGIPAQHRHRKRENPFNVRAR